MDIQAVSTSWLQWPWLGRCLLRTLFPNFLDIYPELGLLGHMVILFLIFGGTSLFFFIVAAPFTVPTNTAQGFQFSISFSTCYFLCCCCFIMTILTAVRWSLVVFAFPWWLMMLSIFLYWVGQKVCLFFFCKIKGIFFIFTNNFIDLDVLSMLAVSLVVWSLSASAGRPDRGASSSKKSAARKFTNHFDTFNRSQHLLPTLHTFFFQFQLCFYLSWNNKA